MLVFPFPWLRRLGQLLKYEQICEIALWQRETQNVNLDVDIFFSIKPICYCVLRSPISQKTSDQADVTDVYRAYISTMSSRLVVFIRNLETS